MNINKEVKTILVRNLASRAISDSMCVYKISVTQTTLDEKSIKTHEGVADLERVKNWNGIDENLDNGYVLADSSVVDKYKKYGMCGDFYKNEKWSYSDWDNSINHKPYSAAQGPGMEFLKLSSYDHSLTLLDKTVVAKPIMFDYMNGSVDNTTYDLERLAELIYKRSDVVFFKEKLVEGPLSENDCKGLIERIPYYNAEEGREETISFLVKLPQEVYTQMLNDLGEDKHSFAQYKYIADNDLAGIESSRLHPEPLEVKKNKFRK